MKDNSISVSAKLFRWLYWKAGVKKLFSLPREEFERKIRSINARRGFAVPTDKKAVYRHEKIFGQYDCLVACPFEQRSKRAVLFFFGGGMILDSDAADRGLAAKMANETGMDVWFPYYPLCLDHSIKETYEVCFACYRKMVEIYGDGNVSTCGFSSGGALAIGMALHNNALGRPVAQPCHIVAASPGEVPWNEAEINRMKALNDKDPAVSAQFMMDVEMYMRHGEIDIPGYMLSGSKGDFTGIEDLHFYYSSDEVLYGAAPCFEKACRKYNVSYTMDVKPGMVHCYCMLPFTPEGRAKWREIIEILKR